MADRIQIGVRVSEDIHASLKVIADRNARSLNGEVELLIRNYVAGYLKENPEIQEEIQFSKKK